MMRNTFLMCGRDFVIIEQAKKRVKPLIPKDLIELVANTAKNHS